jgi:large subunit ribosomal protein L7/L12
MADVSKEQVIDWLSKLPVMELASLTKELEDKWGVKAQVAVAAMGPGPGAAGAGAAAAEEQTEFTVTLAAAGDKKIDVIKVIREIMTLGLKEAKDFVEGAPKTIKEGASKAEAEEIKKKVEAVGAKVEIK